MTIAVIALCILFSGDYTPEDVRRVGYHLEEVPELCTKPKRRGKYIVLKFRETLEECHLAGNSYDGLTNRKELLDLKPGDLLTVGLQQNRNFDYLYRFKITNYFKPLTLSDKSNTYLTLAGYNEARHTGNRWTLIGLVFLSIIIYLNMKPE